jgi:23S rRNA pseudouridine1911/1915/1917 synthase
MSTDPQHPDRIEQTSTFVIPAKQKPERIDAFLTHAIEHATRTRVQRAIDAAAVLVNGQPTRANYKIKAGDVITVTVMRQPPLQLIPEEIALNIIFEDDDLIVIDKPAGILTHPGIGNRTGTLVNAMLWHLGVREAIDVVDVRERKRQDDEDLDEEFEEGFEDVTDDDDLEPLEPPEPIPPSPHPPIPPSFDSDPIRPGVVHRLDRDTTGLMVFGKNYKTTLGLAQQFKARTVHREYVTLVWGRVKEDHGVIEGNIGRSTRNRKLMSVVERGGKHAATEFTVLERYDMATLIRCKLRTGRTHQIRVHWSSRKHPVLGDNEYGGRDAAVTALHHAFRRSAAVILSQMPRQALHARTLGFKHPVTGQQLDFSSNMPSDMQAVIDLLRAS